MDNYWGKLRNFYTYLKENIASPDASPDYAYATMLDSVSDAELKLDSTLRNCMRIIQDSLSQIPLESRDETINALLMNPNPAQSQADFIKNIVSNLFWRGNCFIEIVRNSGRIAQLRIIHWDSIYVGSTARGIPTYKYKPDGTFFNTDDIIHIKDLMGDDDQFLGMGRAQVASTSAKSLILLNRRFEDMLKYGIDITHILTPDRPIPANEQRKLNRYIRKYQASLSQKKHAKIMQIAAGLKVDVIKGTTAGDLDLREAREQFLVAVANACGVPPTMAGSTKAQKYNNLRQLNAHLHTMCLASLISSITSEFKRKLKVDVFMDSSRFLIGDSEQLDRHITSKLSNGIISKNEARAMYGLELLTAEQCSDADDYKCVGTNRETFSTGGSDGDGGSESEIREDRRDGTEDED